MPGGLRRWVSFVSLLLALIATVFYLTAPAVATVSAGSDSVATATFCNYDSARQLSAERASRVGHSEAARIAVDVHRGCSLTPRRLTVVSGVAAEAPTGSSVVRYDPEWASRQLLGQNTPGSTGYAVTPGGRTVSAHAAERVAQGGPGRPPTSLEMVDDILNSGTSVRLDPLRDTIRVRAPQWPGKPYVVVDPTGQHVVTVMVPK